MSGVVDTSALFNWLLNNIDKAHRWRSNTPDADNCPHDCEGGVDIPLPAGTPITALATGPLIGSGPWKGHSVVTQQVPVIGKLYYQHLDALPSIPQCENGVGCQNYTIHAGQLLGYSNADVGEVEIGINPAWGGIWGPPTNGAGWVGDPRSILTSLALGSPPTPPTGGGTTLSPQESDASCKSTNAGSCKLCQGYIPGNCNTDEQCSLFNSDGSVVAAPFGVPGVCVSDNYAKAHTPGGVFNPSNPIGGSGFGLPDWLQHPDWLRVGKGVVGVGLLLTTLALAGFVLVNDTSIGKTVKSATRATTEAIAA